MCAIIVFDICFELYTEPLFGNVGLNGSLSKKVDVSTVNCIKSFSNREIELQLNAEGRMLLFYVDTNSKALVVSFRGADGIWKNIVLGTFK